MSQPEIASLYEVIARLRTPVSGCPWDLEQNFATIAPYTIEEAYEVADAIERNDMGALKDELGDLLLQVVFHSRMAEEAGHFGLQDVIDAICDKMERRHPHIFGDREVEGSAHVVANWEAIKQAERHGKSEDKSAMADVAKALPALLRAQKIQKRAARTGFDWPSVEGAFDKLDEEIGEVKEAATAAETHDEVGDLLFAAVNVSRHLGVDAEAALKDAIAKFERRFRGMEAIAGETFEQLNLDAKEALWQRAKVETAVK